MNLIKINNFLMENIENPTPGTESPTEPKSQTHAITFDGRNERTLSPIVDQKLNFKTQGSPPPILMGNSSPVVVMSRDNARKTIGKNSIESVVSKDKDSKLSIDPLSEKDFRVMLKQGEMGRPPLINSRVQSGISILAQNNIEIERTRRTVLKRQHPLQSITDPYTWKNIPPCVTSAITAIYNHIMQGDLSLFEYETTTNARLFKLQNGITKTRSNIDAVEKQTQVNLEKSIKISEAKFESRMKILESKISESQEAIHTTNIELRQINRTMSKSIGDIAKIQAEQVLKLEEEIVLNAQKFEEIEEKISMNNYNLSQEIRNKLQVDTMEDGEPRQIDLKTFAMKHFEQQDEEKESQIKKNKSFEKRIGEFSIALNNQTAKNDLDSQAQFESKFSDLQGLLDSLTQDFSDVNEKRDLHEIACLEFQQKPQYVPPVEVKPVTPIQEDEPGEGASRRTAKMLKTLDGKISTINDLTIPQTIDNLKKIIQDSQTLLSLKLEKKIKNVEKNVEKKMEKLSVPQLESVTFAEPVPQVESGRSSPVARTDSNKEDEDAYVKLLIKTELNERIAELLLQMKQNTTVSSTSTLDAGLTTPIAAPLVQQPLVNQSHDSDFRLDFEDLSDHVGKLAKQLKVLQLIVDSLPKRKAEDDPNFPEYERYVNQILMDDKVRRNSHSPDGEGFNMQDLKNNTIEKMKKKSRETFSQKTQSHQFVVSPAQDVSLSPPSKNSNISQSRIDSLSPELQIREPIVTISRPDSKKHQFNSFQNKGMIINTSFKGQTSVEHTLAQHMESRGEINPINTSISQNSVVVGLQSQTHTLRQSLQPDGVMRINPLTINPITLKAPLTSRNNEDEGFMSARNKNKSLVAHGMATFRNSTVSKGLPQLSAKIMKKPQNKDGWLPNGTKFERIEGF